MTKILKKNSIAVNIWLGILGVALLPLGIACSSSGQRSNTYKNEDDPRPIVDDNYRLTADRKDFDEMRSQISPEKKTENDEIAFVMQLMTNIDKTPSDVREKFDSALRKRRERFQKDLQKERDEFTKKERADREKFLKGLTDERTVFLHPKHSKDERDEFFASQDERRKDYFENQKERRNDFESDVTERRKNFEDYAREKNADFLQEWRSYQKRYEENQKFKREKEAAANSNSSGPVSGSANEPQPEVKSFLQEFMDIPSAPGTNLESGSNGQ